MSTEPARVQRTRPREKGQKGMPPGSIYVGRGTRWGNPNRIVFRKDTGGWHVEHDNGSNIGTFAFEREARRFAVKAYRFHLDANPELAAAARTELSGRDLACWCALPESGETDWCHGRILLDHANAPA